VRKVSSGLLYKVEERAKISKIDMTAASRKTHLKEFIINPEGLEEEVFLNFA
jgi:hypothetical protein